MRALSPMLKKILEAAEREFGEKGLDGTKILSIAQAAGTSKQLIYHYFESKERLYEITLREMTHTLFDKLLLVDMKVDYPIESIRRFFLAYLDYLQQNPEWIVMSIDQGLHHGAQVRMDRELARAREELLERLEAPLTAGQQSGLVKSSLDANMVFFLITAFVVGSLSLRTVFAMHDGPVSETTQESWRTLMSDFFLDALRA
ncbi:TetR/AcrR family transcriptional regulator [soil metagenome]